MSTRMSGKATMNARAASVIAALPSEGGPSLIVSDPWARSARPRAPDPGCTTRRCTAGRTHAADLEEAGRRSSARVRPRPPGRPNTGRGGGAEEFGASNEPGRAKGAGRRVGRVSSTKLVAFTAVPAHVAECRLAEFRLALQIVHAQNDRADSNHRGDGTPEVALVLAFPVFELRPRASEDDPLAGDAPRADLARVEVLDDVRRDQRGEHEDADGRVRDVADLVRALLAARERDDVALAQLLLALVRAQRRVAPEDDRPFLVRVVGVKWPLLVTRLDLVHARADQLGVGVRADPGVLETPALALFRAIPLVCVEIEDLHAASLEG